MGPIRGADEARQPAGRAGETGPVRPQGSKEVASGTLTQTQTCHLWRSVVVLCRATWNWRPRLSPSTRRCRRYWMSAVAAGGRLPSLWPSAMAGMRWCRRPRVWPGRRSGRAAGKSRRRDADGSHTTPGSGAAPSRTEAAWPPGRLEGLVDPLTRGDPTSRCAGHARVGRSSPRGWRWRVSSTTVGRLLHQLGYRLASP